MKTIIYDFGSNNGDDIPYYFLKSDLVVAVEANPDLCQIINERFPQEISSGKLIIENKILLRESDGGTRQFHIHKKNHVLSQLPKPPEEELSDFNVKEVQSIDPIQLIDLYGLPFYIKIDLENYDLQILKSLFDQNIYPIYLSAEIHTQDIFEYIISKTDYAFFKIVEGSTVSDVYGDSIIDTSSSGMARYSFPYHSAGPFGEDIKGGWLNREQVVRRLSKEGYGWKDLHVTNSMNPSQATKLEILNWELNNLVKFCRFTMSRATRFPSKVCGLTIRAVLAMFKTRLS